MEIKTLEFGGLLSALQSLRLPFGKEPRSTIDFECNIYRNDLMKSLHIDSYVDVNSKDLDLMSTLVKRGDEHAKVLRGVVVYAKIKAPIYWWCEMETYRIGYERLASESTMHIDCKGLSGEELEKAKSDGWGGRLVYELKDRRDSVVDYQSIQLERLSHIYRNGIPLRVSMLIPKLTSRTYKLHCFFWNTDTIPLHLRSGKVDIMRLVERSR